MMPGAFDFSQILKMIALNATAASAGAFLCVRPDCLDNHRPSSAAKAGDPVRRGLSIDHQRCGILDHPLSLFAGDDSWDYGTRLPQWLSFREMAG
jgi:hypothetical protein